MQALWGVISNGFEVGKPFLSAVVLIALLVFVGDRGGKMALGRNNSCLAALCIFAFALGTGAVVWLQIMSPLFKLYNATFNLSYSLVIMYWAFWLLVGVIISAKKLVYENAKRHGNY